jgi:hypothetical protein
LDPDQNRTLITPRKVVAMSLLVVRSYRSAFGGRAGALIVGIFITAMLTLAVPALLRDRLDVNDSQVLAALEVALLVGGLGVILLVQFVTGPVRVDVEPHQVRFVRGWTTKHTWLRDEARFTSLVVKKTTNGVPSGTTRTLVALTGGERTEARCTWFTASTFSDLIAEVAPVGVVERQAADSGRSAEVNGAPPVSMSTQRTRTAAAVGRVFTLDHRRVATKDLRHRWTIGVIVVLLALIIVGLVIASWTNYSSDGLVLAGIVMLATVLLVAPVLGLALWGGRAKARRTVARMPHSLMVTSSTLTVDQQTFYFSQLSGIIATPPTYLEVPKRLVLVAASGERSAFELALGGTAAVNYPTFSDYEEFTRLLGAAAPEGLVRFDLS